MSAMVQSASSDVVIRGLIKNALTDEIDSREMFRKGVDYSYYYEEED